MKAITKIAIAAGVILSPLMLWTMLFRSQEGGDIIVTSDLGEKLISKSSAVSVSDYDLGKTMETLQEEVDSEKRDLASAAQLEAEIYNNCLSMLRIGGYAQCTPPGTASEEKQKSIREKESRLGMLRELRSRKAQVKLVKYRLILVDVNGDRRAGEYQAITCFNKALSEYDLAKWKMALNESPPEENGKMGPLMAVKICDRHARFS